MLNEIPVVNFATAGEILQASLAANSSVLLLGDPGVGKSAIISDLAKKLQMPLHILIGSTLDPTDVGGLPVVINGQVDRQPMRAIREAAEKPVILFLDEISAAPLPVQAAFLRLILERVAGDVELHPETRVVAAANPPEQAPGGFDLSAPLMGRLCVLNFRPAESEVLDYFANIKGSDAVRAEFKTFAAVAGATPDLLQIDCPKDCVTGGKPWGAPRAWERALRMRAAAHELGPVSREADSAILAGSVGRHASTAYRAIMDLIDQLPSVTEICADPTKARIPDDPHKQVAAVGLIGRVAERDIWSAYIYTARLRAEYAMAAHRVLLTLDQRTVDLSGKWAKEGVQARVKLLASVKRFA